MIEFRAKVSKSDGNLGVGQFVHGTYACNEFSGSKRHRIIYGKGREVEIDRDTLQQYTGVMKGAQRIYEGDKYTSSVALSPDHIHPIHELLVLVPVEVAVVYKDFGYVGEYKIGSVVEVNGQEFSGRHGFIPLDTNNEFIPPIGAGTG